MAPAAEPRGLSVQNGELRLRGKPFRGIGVNYYDAFARTLARGDDHSYDDGFGVLRERGIPFVRFAACGYWPSAMGLYRTNKDEYFRRLDGVVRAAEKHNVGLIPSLFWYLPTVPDLAGEPCGEWGNPKGKVHEFMRAYTKEVVTRYRNSPAIWGWEFGNEYNLAADLPNAAEHRPAIIPDLGTAKTRGAADDISSEMVRVALAAFADEVRRHDPDRLLVTGNAISRASAWHLAKEKSWTMDTPDQFAEILGRENPDPYAVLSIHVYPEDAGRLAGAARVASKSGKPLFVGEFGVPGEADAKARRQFEELLGRIEREKVPLAALWVFDFKDQGDYSVTSTGGRAWQLEAIAAANRRMNGR
ncbi:MAG TPA: cellulase family glycosylhydrolase [Verrucomicrobiae bacterium]|nr:cellulase family glycosylhydrolase [Verrucomicrobiae bacterium]